MMLVMALIVIMFLGTVPLVSASRHERKIRDAAEAIETMVRAQRSKAQTTGERRVIEVRPAGFFEQSKKGLEVLAMPEGPKIMLRAPGEEDWGKPQGQQWEFSPIGMVSPLSVRLEDGNAWMEVDFDLLTGRVAEERYAF
jgi:hypothetical protein